MNKKNFTRLMVLLVLGFGMVTPLVAQTKWSGVYGNEWLIAGQKYVRIAVTVKGINQINITNLPADFQTLLGTSSHEFLQLWHRGEQVAIITSSSTAVVFYGEPNDGKFDELLCRPYADAITSLASVTSRMNKYVSLFSDEGAYFLTVGTAKGLRASSINSSTVLNPPTIAEPYHIQTDITLYKTDFSHSTSIFIYPSYMNSFYEYGKTLTGTKRFGATRVSSFPITIKKLNASAKPKIKLLLHSRSIARSRNIRVSIGKDVNNLRLVGTVTLDPFKPAEFEFELQLDASLVGDIDVNGVGTLAFQSDDDSTNDDIFSVSYYSVTYPQTFDLQSKTFYTFNIPPAADGITSSLINLTTPPAGTLGLYDISNPHAPRVITNATPSSFVIPRVNTTGFSLLATTVTNIVPAAQVAIATFTPLSDVPSDYDYFIITTDALYSSALKYKTYRAGTINPVTKGSFKPLILKASDIFNQYNYGEPSAVAVRRCIDFLISDGNKANKFLLLIGNSSTYNLGTKNLANEVPTIGYPGSDLLLVSGLDGETNPDIPAIPVGRIPTNDNAKVEAYLAKVMEYENFSNPIGIDYRKNVIHVSGGKSTTEITSFRNNLQSAGSNFTTPAPFSAELFSYVKDLSNPCPASPGSGDPNFGFTDCQTYADAEIVTKVNSGAGVLSYYGHGNPRVLDYFYGYVSDNARGYTDSKRYSGLFLYGCDVNNVFRGFNDNVATALTNNTRRPFTVDWLLTPNRGAITVIGNTWEGYENTLTPFMNKEYSKLFVADNVRKSIGTILKESATETAGSIPNARVAAVKLDQINYNYNFAQANLHQTLLLGDPAIVLVQTKDPALPVELVSFEAKLIDESSVIVEWTTASEKNNGHFIVQRSDDARKFESIGYVEGSGDSDSYKKYTFYDKDPLIGISYYRLVQVDKDEDGTAATDNSKSFSRIVSVNIKGLETLVIAPNPSHSNFRIQLNPKLSIKFWNLFDINGRLIKSKNTQSVLDMSNFPNGEYIVEVFADNNEVFRKKIVKQ